MTNVIIFLLLDQLADSQGLKRLLKRQIERLDPTRLLNGKYVSEFGLAADLLEDHVPVQQRAWRAILRATVT